MSRRLPVRRVRRLWNRSVLGVALVGLMLAMGGCNVYEGIAPTPKTVDALVSDAETALATGDAGRAVRLFERAYEVDSTDIRVRVGLGNALYADRGIDVFALQRVAEHLVGASGDSAGTTGKWSPKSRGVCTDGAHPDTASARYDAVPLDATSIRRVTERAPVVERVWRLVVVGVLQRQSEAFTATDPAVRRKGLLVGAVTVVARAAIDVRSVLRSTDSALFLDRSSVEGPALVSCASTEDVLAQNHGAVCRLGAAAQQGRQWLQARAESTEDDRGAVLSRQLQTLVEATRDRIDCS